MRWSIRKLLFAVFLPSVDDADVSFFTLFQSSSKASPVRAALVTDMDAQQSVPGPEQARPDQGGAQTSLDGLETLRPRECLYRFRLYAYEIADVVTCMQIPDPFHTRNQYHFSTIEALSLLLEPYKSAGDQYDLAMMYNHL
ncbi:hypothetical protein B0H10DRAFT_2245677 [Mycena sp. CBHHK59/15]|nr:hypothetical protein B0H10DRAFT_2245677 [Mycena sp. CBHHK59/15]